jgi:hypothetical protein
MDTDGKLQAQATGKERNENLFHSHYLKELRMLRSVD